MQDAFYDEFGITESGSRLARIRGAYLKWGSALLSLMVLGLLIYWAYQLGTRDPREIPVIQAMDVPMRVQPEDPGGTQMANQGLEVNEILAGNEAQAPEEVVLAPEAETPPVEETLSEAERLRNMILKPQPEAAPVQETPQPERAELPQIGVEPEAATDEAAPAESDTVDVAEEDLVAALVEQAVADPEVAPEARLRPRVRPSGFDAAAPAETTVAAAPADEAPDAAPELASGTRLVQLGAFESEAQARGHWFQLERLHQDLLGGRDTFIQRAESNGRIFYRLRVLGFDAQEDQRSMCDALQARDVECIPVTVR